MQTIESPLWVLLSSLITNNHQTRFSENETYEGQANILNVYCNGTEYAKNNHFVRLHLMNYLINVDKKVNINELYTKYGELFPVSKKAFNYALYKLIRNETIELPELYLVENLKDIDLVNDISINRVGRYYINTIRNYFEYIVYVKDDVDLENNDLGIKSCIEVRKFYDKFEEVIKFLKYLYSKEKEIFEKLKDKKAADLL